MNSHKKLVVRGNCLISVLNNFFLLLSYFSNLQLWIYRWLPNAKNTGFKKIYIGKSDSVFPYCCKNSGQWSVPQGHHFVPPEKIPIKVTLDAISLRTCTSKQETGKRFPLNYENFLPPHPKTRVVFFFLRSYFYMKIKILKTIR